MSLKDRYAIAGLGVTKQGRVPGISADGFKVDATLLAIADAGLKKEDIDGWIYQGASGTPISRDVPRRAGITPKFVWSLETGGATAVSSLVAAMGAIEAGFANYVVCCFGTNALSGRGGPTGAVAGEGGRSTSGAFGQFSPAAEHALAARRHMHEFGTTSRQLGWIAVTERANANKRPEAMMYARPMTIEDHQNSPYICEPLHFMDYCLVGDGGVALVVTSAERASSLKKPPVYIMGVGLGHQLRQGYQKQQFTTLDVERAKEAAFKMAGIELKDIDVAELYDCFTITVLLELEGYGFCKRGEGGPFVEGGHNIGPEAKIPINTAGNELSWGYFQGFTPLVEGVRQMRGEGEATQVKDAKLCLVSGHGGQSAGSMTYAHSTAILRRGG